MPLEGQTLCWALHALKEPLNPTSLHAFSFHHQASKESSLHLLVPVFIVPLPHPHSFTIYRVTSGPATYCMGCFATITFEHLVAKQRPEDLSGLTPAAALDTLDHLFLFWTLCPWFLGHSSHLSASQIPSSQDLFFFLSVLT